MCARVSQKTRLHSQSSFILNGPNWIHPKCLCGGEQVDEQAPRATYVGSLHGHVHCKPNADWVFCLQKAFTQDKERTVIL